MKKQATNKKGNAFIVIGTALMLFSPIAFVIAQWIAKNTVCLNDGCGYADLGMLSYGFYSAAISFTLGLASLIIGIASKKRLN